MLNLLAMIIIVVIIADTKKKIMNYVTIRNGVATPIERKQLYFRGIPDISKLSDFYKVNITSEKGLDLQPIDESIADYTFYDDGKIGILHSTDNNKIIINIFYIINGSDAHNTLRVRDYTWLRKFKVINNEIEEDSLNFNINAVYDAVYGFFSTYDGDTNIDDSKRDIIIPNYEELINEIGDDIKILCGSTTYENAIIKAGNYKKLVDCDVSLNKQYDSFSFAAMANSQTIIQDLANIIKNNNFAYFNGIRGNGDLLREIEIPFARYYEDVKYGNTVGNLITVEL